MNSEFGESVRCAVTIACVIEKLFFYFSRLVCLTRYDFKTIYALNFTNLLRKETVFVQGRKGGLCCNSNEENWKKDSPEHCLQSNKPRIVVFLEGYIPEVVDDQAEMKQLGLEDLLLWKLSPSPPNPQIPEYVFCAESEADLQEWINSVCLELYREFVVKVNVDPSTAPPRTLLFFLSEFF